MTLSGSSYTKFTDFLQDERFVHWKIFQTEESNAYWSDFLEQNPHLTPLLRKAEKHFANIKIEADKLTSTEKKQLWESVQHPTHKILKTTSRFSRKWVNIAAACTAVVLITTFTLFIVNKNTPEQQSHTKDEIVGNLLKEKEIQLITGNNSLTLDNNAQVQVNSTGMIKVIEENKVGRAVDLKQNNINKLIIPYGKRTQLSLADGSKVWLNSGSVLEFPAQFSGENREIHLASGEIYIEVVSNKQQPFRVKTSNFTVNVYGTKFNLSTYTNHPQSVILVEGSVSLYSDNKKEVNLLPGEQAIYTENKEFCTRKIDTSQFTSWTRGYLIFNKTPIYEVLQQVERYYNLSFNIQVDNNLKNNTCSGKLSLSENLDDVMNTIARLSDTYYTRDNQTVYISSKKPMK